MNDEILKNFESVESPKIKSENLFVRLSRGSWHNSKGIYQKISITFLKRKSGHIYNFLEEDACMVGADEIIPRILNLNECRGGIYKVITCNETRDYESGMIDDYDYKLIKINEIN